MYRIAIVLLLLSAILFAETQEAAYFRAMQAEEAGDISLTIRTFEEALDMDGPYTEEIKGILNDYYDALGIPETKRHQSLKKNVEGIPEKENPWSYRFAGDLSAVGVLYSAYDENADYGSSLQGNFSAYLDYSSGDWIHSFVLNVLGDLNFYNEDMPALDTNDWKGAVGLEYSLVSSFLMLDVGLDLNVYQQESAFPAFYTWAEYDFLKINRHQFGAALWGYHDLSGPMSFALYGSWRKSNTYGFSFSLMAGVRLEVDSAFDYASYRNRYNAALDEIDRKMDRYTGYENGTNPFIQCLELYGNQCYGWDIATIDSLNWVLQYEKLLSEVDVQATKYWTKWLGPSIRGRVQYRFKDGISLETKLNMFYGFVVDGPDEKYERISKLSSVWSGIVLWNLEYAELYLGLEDVFRLYSLPKIHKGAFARYNTTARLKLGSKWEF